MGEWDDLEAMAVAAQRAAAESAKELRRSVRGGAGSPIEERIAKAFSDQAKANEAILGELSEVSRQNGQLRDLIERQKVLIGAQNAELDRVRDALDGAQRALGEGAYEATTRTIERQEAALDRMERQANASISALGKLDASAADGYKKAIDDSCRSMRRSVRAAEIEACGAIAAFGLIGAGGVSVSVWWAVSGFPWAADVLGRIGPLGVALVAVGVWIAGCVVQRIRGR